MPPPTNPSGPGPDDDVTLSAEDARELARLLGLLIREQPGVAAEVSASLRDLKPAKKHSPVEPDRRQLVLRVRAVVSERKRRAQYFNKVMFGEPAWDMLLALYITDYAGRRQTISKLVDWVDAPRSTANRWIDYLEKEHLIERSPHRDDRRFFFVDLTDKARRLLDDYFSSSLDDVGAT